MRTADTTATLLLCYSFAILTDRDLARAAAPHPHLIGSTEMSSSTYSILIQAGCYIQRSDSTYTKSETAC